MDEEPSIINFEASRESAESDMLVRCPRCNKLVFMHDVRCEHCGIHFHGEAWEFSPSTRTSKSSTLAWMPRWFVIVAVIVTLLALLLAYLL